MSKHAVQTVSSPWWIRLAIYVVTAAIGLILTVAGKIDPSIVDGWLGQVDSIAALISGTVAALFIVRHPERPIKVVGEKQKEPESPESALPVHEMPTSVVGDAY